jgi:acetoin utilization protein AcuB
MIAEELIVDNIPPLSRKDTGETALRWMDEFKIMNLSVVENGTFLGTISESDILGMADIGEPIGNYSELFNPACVNQNQHIFEVVKVVNDQKLTIVPVLDTQEHYVGSITIAQLMEIIADMPVANNPGGVIVLELNKNDYSLEQIAHIIEENDTKILGTFITSHVDSTKMELTIKVNKVEIQSIIAGLQRHGFNITFFDDKGGAQDDLRDRFDSFMNYLNI